MMALLITNFFISREEENLIVINAIGRIRCDN